VEENQRQEAINSAFLKEKENLANHNKRVEDVMKVNRYLKQFNWAFIHPYVIGYQVNYFTQLQKDGVGDKKSVFKIFARCFFDLKTTTYFIEAIFKKRPDLEPFCQLIDQSVFMCLQRDYAGAISTLLPVIEGSIRHYLVNRRGITNGSIRGTKSLLSVFSFLKEGFLDNQRKFYRHDYGKVYGAHISFDENQVEDLVGYKEKFVDMWCEIVTEYLEKNLYLDTRAPDISDELNRHIIFHGFTADVYYTLENYLRIFNCVVFLSYAFGLADGGNLMFELEDKEILEKWIAFEKVRVVSWTTTEIKAKAYVAYADFNADEYSEDIFEDPLGKQFKEMPAFSLEHRLRRVEEIMRTAVSNSKGK
jgi:hypothetical protein